MNKDKLKFSYRFSRFFLYLNILFIVLVFLFSFSSRIIENKKKNSSIYKYNGQVLSFKAFVCKEAQISYKSRHLTLCLEDEEKQGRVLLFTSLYPALDYADFLEVRGRLIEPEFLDDFDYPSYLARYGIFSIMYYPQIELITTNLNFNQKIKKKLILFKQKLNLTLNQNLPEPEAGLASAILFGYKKSLANEDLEIFSRVGIRHLIAISGIHITIFSYFLIQFLLFLGLKHKHSLFFVFVFLITYPFVTGLASSTIRASIMGGLVFLALFFNRPKNSIHLLTITAAIMLLFNPMLLRYDLGFQLSFISILGIIYLEPLLNKFFTSLATRSFKEERSIKFANFIFSLLSLTLACQLASLPIILFSFQEISLIAPIANIFLVWLLPLILLSLIFALFFSLLLPVFSLIFFFPAYFLINFIFFISKILADFKFASLLVPKFNFTFCLLYYFLLIYFIKNKRRSDLKNKKLL